MTKASAKRVAKKLGLEGKEVKPDESTVEAARPELPIPEIVNAMTKEQQQTLERMLRGEVKASDPQTQDCLNDAIKLREKVLDIEKRIREFRQAIQSLEAESMMAKGAADKSLRNVLRWEKSLSVGA